MYRFHVQAPIFVHPGRENCDLQIEFFFWNMLTETVSKVFICSFKLKKPNENTFYSTKAFSLKVSKVSKCTEQNFLTMNICHVYTQKFFKKPIVAHFWLFWSLSRANSFHFQMNALYLFHIYVRGRRDLDFKKKLRKLKYID